LIFTIGYIVIYERRSAVERARGIATQIEVKSKESFRKATIKLKKDRKGTIMKKTKRIIGLIICLALSFALFAGCNKTDTDTGTGTGTGSSTTTNSPSGGNSGSSSPSPSPSPTNTGTIAAPEPPPAVAEFVEHLTLISENIAIIDLFNPAMATAWLIVVERMYSDTLIYRNLENEYVPRLAKEWSTADGKNYNFKLRDDVYFHNGEKFTAADVAFTVDKAKDSPGAGIYDNFRQVDSYTIVNDYEITLTLIDVNVEFYFNVASSYIMNEKAYNDDPVKGGWIGTGPWVISEFRPSERIEFTRNENYYGNESNGGWLPVTTKTFTFVYVAETTSALIMMENGEAQLGTVSNVDLPRYKDDPRFQIKDYIMNNCNYLAFNMLKPFSSDINFRLAVAHCINREQMVEIAVDGFGAAVDHGTLWGFRTPFKASEIPRIPFDLDKAAEYLALSGYNGETILITAGMAHTIKQAQVAQQNMAKIGINVEIFDTDPGTFASFTTWGHTEAHIVVNSAVFAVPSSSRNFLLPNMNANKANYENPEVIQLLETAAVTVDDAERERMYRRIQQILADEIPYLGTLHMGMNRMEAAGVGGVTYFPDNNWDFTGAYMVVQG